jgi:hypothetical protein
MHDYLLDYSLGDHRGRGWEIMVTCFLMLYGEKLGCGKLIGINKHLTRTNHDAFSREFDVITDMGAKCVVWECKNIDWQWILFSKDNEALIRRNELKSQLIDQTSIARRRKFPFFFLSKTDIPEDILNPELVGLLDHEFSQILRNIICVCPRNCANVDDKNFKDLFDPSGQFFFED